MRLLNRTAAGWAIRLVPADRARPVAVKFEEAPQRVVVSAVGRAGSESELASIGK